MNNLEPWAKIKAPRCSIGDVVIVRKYEYYVSDGYIYQKETVVENGELTVLNAHYELDGSVCEYEADSPIDCFFQNEDILKNLTTGKEYD